MKGKTYIISDKTSSCWVLFFVFFSPYCIFSKARCSSAKMRAFKIYLGGFYGKCGAIIAYFIIAVYMTTSATDYITQARM